MSLRAERAFDRPGCEGMEDSWGRIVRVVLKPDGLRLAMDGNPSETQGLPERYCEISSLPIALAFSPFGSHVATTGIRVLFPGTISTSRTVAWASTVLLTNRLMSIYGTVAE